MADKVAREVFGLLFEVSTEAVFIIDRASQRIVSANVRAAEMLNRRVGSLIGVAFGELVVEDRDLQSPGHYEDVALRGGDAYPVYVELNVVHVRAEHGELAAFIARDTSARRDLERELVAKHTALVTAHGDLERAHAQLSEAKRELEARNREIALLAWRAAMGEVVAGIAHHLNNPVGALTSTLRRMSGLVSGYPDGPRDELERLLARVGQIARRIEGNVAAIVEASRSDMQPRQPGQPGQPRQPRQPGQPGAGGLELPPELASVLSTFAEQLEDIPTKDQP